MATTYQRETINHSGTTALHQAAGQGDASDPAEVLRLLNEEADINARDDEGRTALHLAARGVNREVVQLLVDGKADINAQDSKKRTALHYLADANRYDRDQAAVRLLLDKGANINAKDDEGKTALQLAANNRNPVISLLLDKGADINAKDNEEKTTLLLAAKAGGQEIVQLLLSKEADISAKDKKKRTALHYLTIASIFKKDGAIVQLLVNKGIDINTKDDEGKTALHSAAEAGNQEIVQALLNSKANINAQDDDGKTALHLVAEKGNIAMVRLLLDSNANINMQEKYGKTALHLVAEKGTIEMVRLMLTKHANRKVKDVHGHTPLDLAIPRGDYWVRRLLDGSANKVCALAEFDIGHVEDYLVIGLMGKRTGRPKEILILNIPHEGLFKVIKQSINQLRPWWRSVFSLKSVQGFSVYECSPDHLRHHVLTNFQDSKQVEINEFFQDYCQYSQDYGDYWKGAVWGGFRHWHLDERRMTDDERREADGVDASRKRYALQLVLRWSATKIAIYGLFPILLSFAIGFWYQTTSGSDANAVKQTAWGIASYIITATALAMTLLAVITQLSDH